MALPRNIRGSASQLFYQDHRSPQYQALLAITDLPHPDRSILGAFLTEAKDPQEAARYFLRETAIDGNSRGLPTKTICEFLSDWKQVVSMFQPAAATGLSAETEQLVYERDGGRCCLTETPFKSPEDPDLRYVYIIPPRVLTSPDFVKTGRLSEMLGAFLSEDSVDSLRSTFSLNPHERLDNIWLSSTRAFELVEAGEVSFHIRTWDEDNSTHKQSYNIGSNPYACKTHIELPIALTGKKISFEDRTTRQTPIPHKDLLGFQVQFSRSLAWMKARRHMEQRQHPGVQRVPFPFFRTLLFRTVRWLWTTLPDSLRATAYEKLLLTGSHLYGRSFSPRIQQLPFGLYLRKDTPQAAAQHRAESHALATVEKFTHIPAPRAIDALETRDASYLLMTQVPGRPIGQMLDTMTDEQVEDMVNDLKRYIAELRAIPNQASKFRICNVQGGGILDWRISGSQSEELRFQTETEFHNYLTQNMTDETRKRAAKSHAVPHAIVFTHGDLNPRNILGEHGKITGIVDWENAGFFPEYWEYTKMHFTVRSVIRWLADVVDQVFEGYRDELLVENMMSDLTGPF